MKFLLGKKLNMTQIFDENGVVHSVTALETGPMTVVQVKTNEKDGYSAVQIGFSKKNPKNVNRALSGHMKGNSFAHLVEFRLDDNSQYKEGDVLPNALTVGDTVRLSGISKGKGFQGVVKRHGFKGGPRSHGQKHSEREPGSIGGGGRDGGRVAKGKRMAGRMGGERITSKNLKVILVDNENNKIYIKGAVPGRRGTLIEVVSE